MCRNLEGARKLSDRSQDSFLCKTKVCLLERAEEEQIEGEGDLPDLFYFFKTDEVFVL